MQANLNTFPIGANGTFRSGGISDALDGSGDAKVGDLFIKLLVAQVRNQDPLNPQDAGQYVSQLAQLSQTESLQKLIDQTSSSTSALQSMQVLALGAQVGSEVAVRSDSVQLAGQPVPVTFELQAGAGKVTLVVGGHGGPERRVELGTRAAGEVAALIDPQALGLPAGRYALRVETDTQETPAIEVHGILQSVKLSASRGVLIEAANIGEVTPGVITRFGGKRS